MPKPIESSQDPAAPEGASNSPSTIHIVEAEVDTSSFVLSMTPQEWMDFIKNKRGCM